MTDGKNIERSSRVAPIRFISALLLLLTLGSGAARAQMWTAETFASGGVRGFNRHCQLKGVNGVISMRGLERLSGL